HGEGPELRAVAEREAPVRVRVDVAERPGRAETAEVGGEPALQRPAERRRELRARLAPIAAEAAEERRRQPGGRGRVEETRRAAVLGEARLVERERMVVADVVGIGEEARVVGARLGPIEEGDAEETEVTVRSDEGDRLGVRDLEDE